MVSSNVIALILSEAKIASLSASVGSSLLGILADKITHMSHKLMFTALRSARLRGEPQKGRKIVCLKLKFYNSTSVNVQYMNKKIKRAILFYHRIIEKKRKKIIKNRGTENDYSTAKYRLKHRAYQKLIIMPVRAGNICIGKQFLCRKQSLQYTYSV